MTATAIGTHQAGHYRFRHAARMEWIKLRTLRSVRWSMLIAWTPCCYECRRGARRIVGILSGDFGTRPAQQA